MAMPDRACFTVSSVSLNFSAAFAVSPLISRPSSFNFCFSCSMPARPWLRKGISSTPLLPKSFTASADFSAPSGIAAKASARSSSTSSVGRNWPAASLTEMPSRLKASTCTDDPPAASTIAVASFCIPLARPSSEIPDCSAIGFSSDSDSTEIPVFWESLERLSAVSRAALPAATSAPRESAAPKPASTPLTLLAADDSPSRFAFTEASAALVWSMAVMRIWARLLTILAWVPLPATI